MPQTKTIVAASALALYSGLAFAQTPPPSQQQVPRAPALQPPPPQPPLNQGWQSPGPVAFAYNGLPEIRGIVQRFTLAPKGELDGFVLTDGTAVHMPPHLSAQLAAAIRQGDPVLIHGYRLSTVPLIVAVEATDTATNQTVIDQGPPPPGFAPPPPPPGMPAPGAQPATINGRVQTLLYGPAGDLNGAVLEDGTIIRLAPPAAFQGASLLAPGRTVSVQGWALSTAYGRVIEVQAISPA